MLEVFMPVTGDETFFTNLLDDVRRIPFYKGLELPVIFQKENREHVRKVVEEEDYQLTIWASPNISGEYSLCSLDSQIRKKSVDYAIELIRLSSDMHTVNIGVPSGNDPGDEARPASLDALYESYCRMSEAAAEFPGLHITVEPLDRFAHKKQILGPIKEVTEWFAVLKKDCPNYFIHWDSAHEALGNIDLIQSMEYALPYMAQFHICNCVTDPTHPCYGDWHMEVGEPPEFKNWGYLDVDTAAGLLKRAALADKVEGVRNTHCALEVRTHMGDDLWKREHDMRAFLMAAYDRAGLTYDR